MTWRRIREQNCKNPNSEVIEVSSKNKSDEECSDSVSKESSTSSEVQENSGSEPQKTQQAFFKALQKNDSSELAAMIAGREWNLNAVDPETGFTPLSLAVRNENFECVKFLLRQGVDVNARNHDGVRSTEKSKANGSTPLLVAARNGYAGMVGLLLQHGAGMWMTGPDNSGALDLAVRNTKAVAALETLLIFHLKGWYEERTVNRMKTFGRAYYRFHEKQAAEAMQRVDGTAKGLAQKSREQRWKEVHAMTDFNWYINEFSAGLETLTLVASKVGSRRAVEILLAFGAQIGKNAETWRHGGCKGCHALSIAATFGHVSVVKLLIESGAIGIDAVDENGDTALHCATRENRLDTVACLLRNGAATTIRNKANKTAVEYCKNIATKGLFFADKKMASIDTGDIALICATRERAQEAFVYLLAKGQDVHKANKKGEAAIGLAIKSADFDMVKSLHESRYFHVDHVFEHGDTPLMHAVRNGNLDTAAYLLDKGANTAIRNRAGNDAFKLSLECGDKAMELLLASVRKIDATDDAGNTALICAVRKDSVFAVDYLRRRGANAGIRNIKGETARSISVDIQAANAKSNEVLNILTSYSWHADQV